MKRLLCLLACACPLFSRALALEFGPLFSSGMVLQRDEPITVTGHGSPDAVVQLTFGGRKTTATAGRDGIWTARFAGMEAGGPHVLQAVSGDERAQLDDILLGDVWVCSGQSNMQMGLAETHGGAEAIAAASSITNVRVLTVPSGGADTPQVDLHAKWQHCTADALTRFSAVAWYLASNLHADPKLADIPLGIVNSSFGGTSIEAWTPAESLRAFPSEQLSGSMFGIKPASLFHAMIHPMFAWKVKGVVWYQGEANAGHPEVYAKLLRNMIGEWRKGWGKPDLPFFIVQLPAFDGTMGGLDFGWLREAQDLACRDFPHAELVTTYDTTDGSDLHPREKQEIGHRAALLARREVYGQDVIAHGPRQTGVRIQGDKVTVTFDQDLAIPDDEPLTGFALAGSDGDYRFANAKIEGRNAVLHAEGVDSPLTVRYAWNGLPHANLANRAGLPAYPFRTDKLAPQSIAFQPMPVFQRLETPVYQLETGRTGRIASLMVRGRQFLSNESDGGTSIPTFFGPRNLTDTRQTGPGRLILSDAGAELEIACNAGAMQWTVRNKDSGAFDFHIALNREVEITKSPAGLLLRRDGVLAKVSGEPRVDGNKLILRVEPKGSVSLGFLFPESSE